MTDKIFTVLVADSEPTFRERMSERLSSEGFRVFSASTSKEALAYARKRNIDAAIIDAGLKDIEGYRIIPILKDINEKIKIIMTTANPSEGIEIKCREAGIIFYGTKQVDFDLIVQIMKNTVEKTGQPEFKG